MLFYETTLKSYELPLEVPKRAIRIRKNHYNLKEESDATSMQYQIKIGNKDIYVAAFMSI